MLRTAWLMILTGVVAMPPARSNRASTSTAARRRRIASTILRRVRVENLGSPGPAGRVFKVLFRAGSAAGETNPKQSDAGDSIEWTEPLKIQVHDAEASLIASVVTRGSSTGAWCFMSGCRFEGSPVKVFPSAWRQVSVDGPSFCAKVETGLDGNSSEGTSGPPPMLIPQTNEGVLYDPSATSGVSVVNPPTVTGSMPGSTVDHVFDYPFAGRIGGAVDELLAPTWRREIFCESEGQREGSMRLSPVWRRPSYVEDGPKEERRRSTQSTVISSSISPPFRKSSGYTKRHAISTTFSTSPIAPPEEGEHSKSVQQDKLIIHASNKLNAGDPVIYLPPSPDGGSPVIYLTRPSPHPWSTTDRNRYHSKETVQLPSSLEVERYEVSPYDSSAGMALIRPTRGPKSGTGDASVVSARREQLRWARKQPAGADMTHVSEGRKPSVLPVRSLSRVLTDAEMQLCSSAAKGLASLVAVVPERLSHAAAATTSSCPTSAVYRLGGFAGLATTDPVCFSCTLPRSVREGLVFRLRISAYLRPDLDEELGPKIVARMVNSSVPGISRGQRVTVKLDVPDNMFKVLGSSMDGFEKAAKPPREKDLAANLSKAVEPSMYDSNNLARPTGGGEDGLGLDVHHDIDLPDNMFKFLGSSVDGFQKAAKPPKETDLAANLSKAVEPSIHDSDYLARPTRGGNNDLGLDAHYDIDLAGNLSGYSDPAIPESDEASPAVQDFVWNGSEQHATFTVMCLPDAPVSVVRCGASISEGGRAIHSSFHIKVGEAGGTRSVGDNVTAGELDSALEEVKADVTMADPSGPTTSGYAPVRSMRRRLVLPLTPFILADRVDPGPSVHESKGHGFRLTVQEGSLHSAIGPITIQEFAQVVRCEDDGHDYLVKTTVGCLPSGNMFPDEPLLMDFMANETSRGKVLQLLQVLVRKDDDRGWRKIESQVRKDQRGTYVRAAVRDFCFFVCGRQIHPSDPARIENCDEKGMIEVQNATGVDLYLVLVPVSFSSDRTCHVTYTGKIGFGVAGLSFDAGVGSGHESVEKSYLLPAGLTPDEVSVPAGGTFHFEPPPDATRGKLLIATIAEDSQAGLSVRVVVLHGKFITSIGKRRVILPSFLQSKSRISATLGPDDIPVNMVMIMAGLGSKAGSSTAASTPENTLRLAARSPMASVAPTSTVVSAAGPSTPTPRRNGAAPGCGVS